MTLTYENTSKFVQAGDVKIHYHEAGSGPTVLMIHGGAPGAYGWGNFGQNLETFSKHFRTLIVDLPGFGRSDKPVIEGGRYAFYAEAFENMLKALKIDKCHIVGLATGGAAGLMMAMRRPEIVDRLVLVSSAGGIPLFQTMPSEGLKVIGGYFGGEGATREKMRHYLETIIYDKASITEELIDERYEVSINPEFVATAPEGHGHKSKENIEPLWKDLAKVKSKTLILWGRDNRVLSYEAGLFMLSQLPDAQINVYSQAGLWVPWEKKNEFNRDVISFLAPEKAIA